jgi:histidinol-phosphate aminotransferase
VRPPYNISVLNYECALFALEHKHVFAEQALDIRTQRARLQEAFKAFPSMKAWPSDANMILVRFAGSGEPAQKVFEGLKARGVLVKNVSKMHALLKDCLRITVGSAKENDALLAALKEIL